MAAPAVPPRHGVSLALQSLVEHMLHYVNMCLHPAASTTADQLCMGVVGDAPQALSIIYHEQKSEKSLRKARKAIRKTITNPEKKV